MTTDGVRYARVGETSIAYRVLGEEGPYFLDITGPAPGLLWAEHPLTRRHWYQRISRFARPVVFDVQGSGRSDPLSSGIAASVEHQAEQAIAVLTSAGIEHAYLGGWDAGGAAAVTVAAQRPDLVAGLVLVNAYARTLVDDDYPWGVDRSTLDRYLHARRDRHGTGFLLDLLAPSVAHDPEVREFWVDYEQQISSPAQAMALSRIAETLDVRPLLPHVRAPTLVIQSADDAFFGPEHGRYLAAHIPGARLVEVPGRDHLLLWESGEAATAEIETFVTGVRPAARAERVLLAVLFVDLVGSTERAREFGDRRWRRVLDEFERVSSEEIARFRGRLVKNTGDGALATFGSASDAIDCAVAMRRVVREFGLETHSGIHVGDVERRGDDIGGTTVNIASRVMGAATGGEVLVTSTARDAAAGSGTRFVAAGEHALKGLPDPLQLHRVDHGHDPGIRDP
ncbi:MAG: adenylate/guanylate cyclase domain-containing protein [Actinobacteria bacterium]|nr:adenylate/guanylate cyclase domain-containing protein [Actinomycetota bacterium]